MDSCLWLYWWGLIFVDFVAVSPSWPISHLGLSHVLVAPVVVSVVVLVLAVMVLMVAVSDNSMVDRVDMHHHRVDEPFAVWVVVNMSPWLHWLYLPD